MQKAFHSPFKMEAWTISQHVLNPRRVDRCGVYVGTTGQQRENNLDAQMEGQAKAKKAAFGSQEGARVANSSFIVIPIMFNQRFSKRRAFSTITSFSDFNSIDKPLGAIAAKRNESTCQKITCQPLICWQPVSIRSQ
jgi:hypothetical protein